MKLDRTTLRKRRLISTATLATLILTLSGCGNDGQKREYATPSTLCGISVDGDALAPFLPSGRKITVKDKSYPGAKGCQVIVDNKLIFTTNQMWLKEGSTTAFVAARQSLDATDHSADSGRFRYSEDEAYGKTRDCVDTKYKQELFTIMQASGSTHGDAEAMKRLIISYTKEVEKSAECTAGAL
ncbi:hypothetical protein G3M58_65035 [Streptomyces sp. SID7499]|uniref:DUF3558 domain-containing protein n=1 Tax=Streptomyces sp. SID7499 TaxID=2706086 RepID=A0A6G3XI90_9ACTN|nr:hypothetical protein [Streptomyces sp. SID7499]